MAPKSWMELVLKLASEGDDTADARKRMLDEQVRQSMDGKSHETLEKIDEDRRRGVLKHLAT